MGGTVIVRLQPVKEMGNLTHDLDKSRRPNYVDHAKTYLNSIVMGDPFLKSRRIFSSQKKAIKQDFNATKQKQRDQLPKLFMKKKDYIAKRRKIRNWQSHMKSHLSGFIGFGHDAQANKINRAEMDECAKKYVDDFCERHQVELLYLVRHEDETTVHFHFVTTNYAFDRHQTLRLDREDLRQEQDRIGEAFHQLGLKRGVDKQARLKQASEKLKRPMRNGRYSPEVWKEANAIHRTVKQLHEDLPLEASVANDKVQKARIEAENVQDEIKMLQEKAEKNRRLIESNTVKLDELRNHNQLENKQAQRIEKRIQSYLKREKEAIDKIKRLEVEFKPPKTAVIDYVSGYKSTTFNRKNPVIKKAKVVSVKEARRTYEAAAAKEKTLKAEQQLFARERQSFEEQRLKSQQELEDFFRKQTFKHLLVFGRPMQSHDDMMDFIRWYEQDTGWTETNIGTRFKVQKENEKVVRVVVERTPSSPKELAQTLLYAAQRAGIIEGVFTGSEAVLLELWRLNQAESNPIQLKLTDEQQGSLEAKGEIEAVEFIDESELGFSN